jgi:hypothetical protein
LKKVWETLPYNNAHSASGDTFNCVLQLSYILPKFHLLLVIFTVTIGGITGMM